MADPFVWFDLRSTDPGASGSFYQELLGWDVAEVSVGDDSVPMVGGEQPWASIVADQGGERPGWFPYLQVEDLAAATERARRLGAAVLQPPAQGPAGTSTPIREPGGAVVALFQARA
jgi:predicted enzyme related to lactoylglutathione lyase